MKLPKIPVFGLILAGAGLLTSAGFAAEPPPSAFVEAGEKRRAEIPLGGDFRPDPVVPVFVAVGHGARILLSRDDGRSWEQVFWGYPGSDHGAWATKSVAYAEGVFVVPIGWGGPTSYLASEDGVSWRHLTDGSTRLPEKGADKDPSLMPEAWAMVGGKGAFVAGGYMTMTATPDLGKTFSAFSLREFKNDPRPRELVTHHVGPVYCGDGSGRFLALGQDRAKANPVFGNLFASDDLGKTWAWLEPELLNGKCEGYTGMVSNGKVVVIVDAAGENAFRSLDAGDTWEGPFATGCSRAILSLVNDEFWLAGTPSRASVDSKTWRDLPDAVPVGKIVASERGTLISIEKRRFNILRSDDEGKSWDEVYSFEPATGHVHGAQGLRDIAFGYVAAEPVKR